jgi:rubrerythrin
MPQNEQPTDSSPRPQSERTVFRCGGCGATHSQKGECPYCASSKNKALENQVTKQLTDNDLFK